VTGPPSIRRRLLGMLISAILLVWFVVLVLVYRAAEHEVREVFDADLQRSARILQALLRHEAEEEQETADKIKRAMQELGQEGLRAYPLLGEMLRDQGAEEARERIELAALVQEAGHRYGAGLVFVARYADGSTMLRDASAPDVPLLEDGYADVPLADDVWRIFSLRDRQTGLVVQVGERLAFRSELVGYITRNTLMPLLLALPVIALLIGVLVGRALRPLQRVAEEVSARAADALDPIDDSGAPREIRGLVEALNKLFWRVRSAMQRERRFTADAAHELRTPLAALKTHLQVAQACSDPAIRDSLDQAVTGVDRAAHSIEQLLLLARADADKTKVLVDAPVDLRELALWAVSTFSQQAIEQDIDLGMDAPLPIKVRGDAGALQVVLRNLVDNALRYTPRGGTVTLAVGSGQETETAWLQVADDGPGVAPEEREKVFQRFHRGAGEQAAGVVGSGLGLSIVQRIADLHGARIVLHDGLNGRGLTVRIEFPRYEDSPGGSRISVSQR
jgi:two-component system sensor histidine kinase QseC